MKLVLLPGLHGTGELFETIIPHLQCPTAIIELPDSELSDGEAIGQSLSGQLPDEPVIILAESFSGCLIPNLLKFSNKKIVGVIFVASFIVNPNKCSIQCCRLIPKFLFQTRFLVKLVLSVFFLNGCTNKKVVDQCVGTVLSIPHKRLRARLKVMADLPYPKHPFSVPTVYLQAMSDRVVKEKAYFTINRYFKAKLFRLDGPHFLLQTKPEACAAVINTFICGL